MATGELIGGELTTEHTFANMLDMAERAHPLLAAVDALHDALVALDDGAPGAWGALDDDALDAAVVALAQLRCAADRAWLVAAREVEARGLHRRHHERDAASWLARVAGERAGVARRDVELAVTLAGAPVVADAARSHGLSKAKTAELARGRDLPAVVVEELAAAAEGQTVGEVGAAVTRARAVLGQVEPPVESTCEVTRRHDRVELAATLGLVDGEVVETALDSYAATAGLPKDLPYAERRAAALVGLARYWLDHADAPAATRVGRPHVLVVVDLAVLEARTGGFARLGSGAIVSGDEARRLAEDAGVARIITSGTSQVLDVGRTTRSVPPHLAKAVIARDEHCRFTGCTAPPWACEIHHREPWAAGGPTAIGNVGLLCWFHHQLVHRHGAHRLRAGPDGTWHLDNPQPHAA